MRRYGQYCPITRGSEVLAERWVPIILRNVLLGCTTFNQIAAGAPGLSRGLLTRRLRELERAGVIQILPKPDGHGSRYVPTAAGRELWPVLQAVGDWAERWMEPTAEDADPDVVLWSWCQSFLRHDLLPEQRVVVRFRLERRRGSLGNLWLLIERGEGEICNFDPGFGDDVVVTVHDPLVFARWHLGLVAWGAALDAGAVSVTGPPDLCRALPTWNAYPAFREQQRAAAKRLPGGPSPLPPEEVPGHARALRALDTTRPDRTTPIPGFQGQVVTPTDPGYDAARAVWNGAVDRRPCYVARCLSPEDVAAALRFGCDRGLPVTVRGGGHHVAGTAVCDDGLVIDMAPMKAVSVDPATRTAVVQAGALWGELDAATQAFGLATTGGIVSHTGIAGLTLGGGMGWLMRRHGLAVDNLLSAQVVTAGGKCLTASEHDHPDLFWALRGGGGGLGVVTAFTYRLHPVGPEVLAGPVIWALEDAPEVLGAYREFTAAAPPEVASIVTLRRAPAAPFLPVELHRRPVCMISLLALGEPEAAERLLAPLRTFGRPLLDLVRHRPYTNLQSLNDPLVPHGWHYYWKSAGLRTLDDTVTTTMVEHAARASSPRSYTIMFHLGGALADVDPDATAYSRRHVPFELNVNAAWLPHQADALAAPETDWTRTFIAAVKPYHDGAYLNFLDHDDQQRTREAFTPAAYERLTAVRKEYDPDGVLAAPSPPSAG